MYQNVLLDGAREMTPQVSERQKQRQRRRDRDREREREREGLNETACFSFTWTCMDPGSAVNSVS